MLVITTDADAGALAAATSLHHLIRMPRKEADAAHPGVEIRRLRRAARISQVALARQLGVARRTVVGWERCEYRPGRPVMLALRGAIARAVKNVRDREHWRRHVIRKAAAERQRQIREERRQARLAREGKMDAGHWW